MVLSARITLWICVAFALLCLGVALNTWLHLDTIADAAERDVATGYAGFWAFLGMVGGVFGALSWIMVRGKIGRTG